MHSTQTFPTIAEAEAWFEARLDRDPAAPALLAICRGQERVAEGLYRAASFRNRWAADVAYWQAHYLLYLRRRERLFEQIASLAIGVALPAATADPWTDVRSLARRLEEEIEAGARPLAARSYLLGHAYLAIDFHEAAEAAYRAATACDPVHPIPSDNPHLLESVHCEPCKSVDRVVDTPSPDN